MRKIFILGAGEIGKRISEHLGDNWEVTFVDSNDQASAVCQKKAIGFKEYLEKYSDEFIIVAHLHEEASIQLLKGNGIVNYLVHCDLPGEFKEPWLRNYLKNYVVGYLGTRKDYVLYGVGIYSIVIDDWMYQQFAIHPPVLVQNNISEDILDKIIQKYDGLNLVYDIHRLKEIQEIGVCLNNCSELENHCKYEQYCLTDLFDCTDRIIEYWNPGIEKFHNIHEGKRCFIVATGPSLRMEDLDTLNKNKEICISMNSIFYAFKHTVWRPDYYVVSDYRCYSEYEGILDNLSVGVQFLSDNSEAYWKNVHDESIYCYHQHYEYCYDKLPKFSEDFSRKSYAAGTVTYTCLQLAVYMGFKEIYLLGTDFTGGGTAVSVYGHFYAERTLTAVNFSDMEKGGYEKAEQYTRENGIKIYNATRGGELEVFERIDFDSLFSVEE